MAQPIKTITIEGFKSIRKLVDFPLGPLNVLIGANGAGKSNFVEAFNFVRMASDRVVQKYVAVNGGANRLMHLGPEVTPQISIEIRLDDDDSYRFQLEPTADNLLVFASETARLGNAVRTPEASGYLESQLVARKPRWTNDRRTETGPDAGDVVSGYTVYDFHQTGLFARMRRDQSAYDHDRLWPDGGNLAAYLLRLRERRPASYDMIRDTLRGVLPGFDDFRLRVEDPTGVGDDRVRLEWTRVGSEYVFQPFQLSDGTIRFICLATALLQPDPPATMVFDEPELGLHPHALSLVGELIGKASFDAQVIVSTQSASLLSEFEPGDVVVVTNRDAASAFRRLGSDELTVFLEDYSLGALWEKNYIAGAANG